MGASARRHLVFLEAPAEGAPGTLGDRAPGWRPVLSDYAELKPLSGRELEIARQLDGRASLKVTMPFLPGVRTSWRVRVPGIPPSADRLLNIVSVTNKDERDVDLELSCTEVAA